MSNKVALTQQALLEPKSLKDVFDLEAFQNNFVQNYKKTTGLGNGPLVFEREKVLFLKAVAGSKQLEACDRFSIYSSFIELAVSGLTLNDGLAYIIPYGKAAQFQPGWKGRLEQISQMPEISFVNQPQVVRANDDFEFELGESPRILKHKPAKNGGEITFVYLVLDLVNGEKKTFLMSREEVLNIRDRYSQPYKSYVAECKAQGVEIGKPVKKKITGKNGTFEITLEPPMWITSEDEAFKKTLVKRAYKYLPKTPRMKALDMKLADKKIDIDADEVKNQDIDYGIIEDHTKTQETEESAGSPFVDESDLNNLESF